jgi:tripeptidyl-peptidase-1
MVHGALLLATALFSSDAASVETPVQRPSGWVRGSRTNHEQTIELLFAVKQQGKQELHDALMRVSRPSSPEYGQHLSNDEVHQMTAPDPAHVEAVVTFIRSHGGEPVTATPNSDMITAKVTTETAERMLSATYHQHHHSSGKVISRIADGYSLPDEVALAVDFVSPTVHFPGVHRPTKSVEVADNDGLPLLKFNSPTNLRQLYNVDVEGKADGNKQAVTAFLEQGYADASLKKFWSSYCDGINCGKGEVSLVGDATTGHGTESMLDIETITGVAGNVESEFWGFSGRSPDNAENEPFMKWLALMSSTGDDAIPKIFSTSYGEDENSWSLEAATRLNTEFQKAGARGISLLYASGDEGPNCKNGTFVPEGPGSSPYVTSVGGTQPNVYWPAPGGEKAVGLSSGGFSNYWDMPDWQKDAVAKYLTQDDLPDQSKRAYNTSGRAYPDISAQAFNFVVVDHGIPEPGVAGTSCASPLAAGIFSLLNDLRMQAGKSSLGFLNPFIYENAASFNDITVGQSRAGPDCGLTQNVWPAKEGWDAVTGVGTPDYAKLAEAVSALPAGRDSVVV